MLLPQRPFVEKNIRGIAIGLDQLFVVQQLSSEIQVFDLQTLKKQRSIFKREIKNLWDIVESSGHLYVSEQNRAIIYKFTFERCCAKWNAASFSATLSTTQEGNILASYPSTNTVVEYTPEGIRLHQLSLGCQLISPSHAILLRTGEYIVCDIMGHEHRLVKLNNSGNGIREFGRLSQLEKTPLKAPRYLIGCGGNHIMIADQDNNRILLMNSNLELIRELVLSEHNLEKPFRMCLDRSSGRLFVAEQGQHRLKIFEFPSIQSQNRT